MLSTRPQTADLVFQVYGRPMHPELFEICQTRQIDRGTYSARIQITTCGHLVTWKSAGLTLTEVATSTSDPLPKRRRLLSHTIRHHQTDRIECRGGVRYQVSLSLEKLPDEQFWSFQDELVQGAATNGLLHQFNPQNRLYPGALSYLHLETDQRSFLIQAFHTFPDELAVVKSQSLFELPRKLKNASSSSSPS